MTLEFVAANSESKHSVQCRGFIGSSSASAEASGAGSLVFVGLSCSLPRTSVPSLIGIFLVGMEILSLQEDLEPRLTVPPRLAIGQCTVAQTGCNRPGSLYPKFPEGFGRPVFLYWGLEKQQCLKTFSWEQANVALVPGSEVNLIMALGKAFSEPILRPQLTHL